MVAPEADVILAIRHQMNVQRKIGHFHHVKGHQDEIMKFSALEREAKYNVLFDEYASQTLEAAEPSELPYCGSRAMLKIDG